MFSNAQYTEMVLIYGQCNRNRREAARQFALKFPNENHPSPSTISRSVKRLKDTGSFRNTTKSGKVMHPARQVPVEDVLGYALAYPQSSVRTISKASGYSKSQVWNILNYYGAHPYHPRLVQSLMPGDKERRFDFCNWILNELEDIPWFVKDVLWTDESQFTRQGIVNTQNTRYWALENPHIIRQNKHQVRWSVNVWCGIWKNTLIGPYFFEGPLTAEKYIDILQGPVFDYLDEFVSLRDVSQMWYQHDGAPAHKALKARKVLAATFGKNILGYGGSVEWPPRSPDLNLDYFLWGFLKSKVYEEESTSRADLLNRILVACKCVTPTMIQKVLDEFSSRGRVCIAAEGVHFEQIS